MSFGRFLVGTTVLLLAASPAVADVVFPARLLLTEVERGTYEVVFTLPILEGGRKLRAEPSLPPSCRDETEREIETTSGSFTERWRSVCEPASLAGEAVLIEGLLGTQTEILVEIRTHDGRLYSELLKPSRPGLVVPEPPSWLSLAAGSALGGMRRIVTCTELWVLLLVATCLGMSRRSAALGIVAFAAAHALGQWAAARNGLLVSPHVAPTFVLLTALVSAIRLARGGQGVAGWIDPPWVVAILLGALSGGARPETVAIQGLSRAEQVGASLFFAVGIALGLALVAATALELRQVLRLRLAPERISRVTGYAAGVLSVGWLVHRMPALLQAGRVATAPLELILLAAVLGAGASLWWKGRLQALFAFTALLGSGLALGFAGRVLPFGNLLVFSSLVLFGLLLFRKVSIRFAPFLGASAVLAHAFGTGRAMAESVTLPVATAAGAGLFALSVFYVFLRLSEPPASPAIERGFRWLGLGAALLSVSWRALEYLRFFDVSIATDAALGLVRIPLLALALLTTAAIVWPRRRRVLRELGIERRATDAHWALVGLAFFVLPIGNLAVGNPFFEPSAPRGDDARRVLTQVLWNTYHAFNIRDEDELYETLSQSVTEDLVGDLYLDSRRRLTAGTREGAEVTVRDVSVVEVGDTVRGTSPESGFAYACKWIVVARVRHLQHVHHRRNIYNGNIVVRVDGDRWKIAGVELTSEDRIVLPWNPT